MSSRRPSDISCQARERLLQLCQELRLQVNCRKSSLIPSQDMTYLDMQIQSVRFIANPTATWVGNLSRYRGVSFIPRSPSCSLASSSWAIQRREGVDLSLPVPDLSFYSDESDVSWGVLVGKTLVSEFWFPGQKGDSPSTSGG